MSVQEYVLRVPLLCVDRTTRTFASIAPGSVVTYVSPEQQKMVVLSFRGREILAFAADFEERAEAVAATESLSFRQSP